MPRVKLLLSVLALEATTPPVIVNTDLQRLAGDTPQWQACVCVCVKVIMALFLTAELTQLVCNKAQSGLKHNRTRRTGC